MKYKYLKGSSEDFDGAPDWATLRIKGDNEVYHSFIGALGGIELVTTADGADGWWQFNPGFKYSVIAHREPITDDEQDLNDCIDAPEATIQDIPLRDINGAVAIEYPGMEELITERGTRYGKFKDGADIMQSLKDTMRDVDGWNNLTASQKEALDMIQHKIGRILNGDPTYDDSWKDIAGYATLIVNELNGEVK